MKRLFSALWILILGGVAFGAAVLTGVLPFPSNQSDTTVPLDVARVQQAEPNPPSLVAQPPEQPEAEPRAIDETKGVAKLQVPRLEDVRIEEDGLAIVAGRAAPHANLILRVDTKEFARTTADGAGAFAAVGFLSPSAAVRVLSLAQIAEDGQEVLSPDELFLAPVAGPEIEVARNLELEGATDQGAEAETGPNIPVLDESDMGSAEAQEIPETPDATVSSEQEAPLDDTELASTNAPNVDVSAADSSSSPLARALPAGTAPAEAAQLPEDLEAQPDVSPLASAKSEPDVLEVPLDAQSVAEKAEEQVTAAKPNVLMDLEAVPAQAEQVLEQALLRPTAPSSPVQAEETRGSVNAPNLVNSGISRPALGSAAPVLSNENAGAFDVQLTAPASESTAQPQGNSTMQTATAELIQKSDPASTKSAPVLLGAESARLEDTPRSIDPGLAPKTSVQTQVSETNSDISTAPSASRDVDLTVEQAPEPQSPPQQVAILKSNEDGVQLLQPSGPAPDVMSQVALDTIGYSVSGTVQLAGRAQSFAREVRVYLDNAPIAALQVDGSGAWRGALPNVDTGVYTLRIDEVDATGSVTSRVETPFKREDPAVLEAATADTDAPVTSITVQTGNTLWAIARERYGQGTLYVRVFDANRAAIQDPDLIYPGQVFTLPAQ